MVEASLDTPPHAGYQGEGLLTKTTLYTLINVRFELMCVTKVR